jgi:hypothetical protein
MATKTKEIGNIFTDDQKELIALYEKQIDNQLAEYYIEGKELKIMPKPYPNYNWKKETPAGCDQKVVDEILRKYREAGWLIKWEFVETNQIDGNWVFILKKIDEFSDFKGKSLEISFPYKNHDGDTGEHHLIVPILGVCNTKVTTPNLLDCNTEYLNFCIPANFYITESEIIKFVRYYKSDSSYGKRWQVCCQAINQDEILVSENLKVRVV